MEPVFFIGYEYLECWLTVVDRARPVYANLMIEPGETDQALRTDTMVILVAQPEHDLVHYCRLPVATLNYLDGQTYDPDHETRVQAAKNTWELVNHWLDGHDLTVRNGIVAAPAGLRLQDGWANFLPH